MHSVKTLAILSLGLIGLLAFGACTEKPKVVITPAYSGTKPDLPAVPSLLASSSLKVGDTWTIYGLQHHLNSPRLTKEVDGKPANVSGYVVEVYKPEEPAGKEGCVYPSKKFPPTAKDPTPPGVDCAGFTFEPPHFYIAEKPDEKDHMKMIKVMGYASSYIQMWRARDQYKGKEDKIDTIKEEDLYADNNYSAYPIKVIGEPKIGSKVLLSGQFGRKFEEGQGGRATSPFGILNVSSGKKGKVECVEGGKHTCLTIIELK